MKKGPFVDPKVLQKIMKQKDTGARMPIKTWARSCIIAPEFVGHKFDVHNGNKFIEVYVTEDMVGHKLGEFAITRIFRAHGGASSRKEKEAATATPAT
jgi:small subunit ribosomal protein S19